MGSSRLGSFLLQKGPGFEEKTLPVDSGRRWGPCPLPMGQVRAHSLLGWLICNELLLGEEGKQKGAQEGVSAETRAKWTHQGFL